MQIRTILKKMIAAHLHIIFIIITALFLRMYKFKQGEVMMSSDEIYLLQYSMKPAYGLLSGSFEELVTQLFRFFNFGWGWGTLASSAVNMLVLTIFNFPLTEFTINFPYIITGIFSVIAFYFLCVILTQNKILAFFCSFILAVLPFHVSMSRSIAGLAVSNSLFFFITLLLFIRYFQLNKTEEKLRGKKELFFGMIFLGMYFCTDNQFPGILPIILVGGLIFSQEKSVFMRLKSVLRPFFSKFVLLFFVAPLPTILGTLYLLTKRLPQGAYILNLFHSKEISFHNRIFDFMDGVYNNVGPVLLALFIVAFFYNFYAVVKRNEYRKERVFVLFWVMVTATPWLFLLSPEQVWFRIYIIQPMAALIVLTVFLLFDSYSVGSKFIPKKFLIPISIGIFVAISMLTILSTSNLVYRTTYLGWDLVSLYGSVEQNTGIKSAGYYIREKLTFNSVIFSGVEIFNAQYYFGSAVKIVGDLDLSDEKLLDLYVSANESGNITHVFLTKKQYGIFSGVLRNDKFSKEFIFSERGVEKSAVFSKKSAQTKIIVIEETDTLFNNKYGSLRQLYINFG